MLLEAQLELVFQEVADFYGVKLSDILGKRRLRTFIEPRFVAIHLAKKIGGRVTWPEVWVGSPTETTPPVFTQTNRLRYGEKLIKTFLPH